MRPTIPTTRGITTGLVGGPNWTTVSLLNGVLTHATLPATHKRRVIAILAEKAIARQQQVIDLNPDLPTPPTLRSAA